MDLSLTPEQRAFRESLRSWLAANPPGEMPAEDSSVFRWRRAWQKKLHAAGYAGLTWPRELGGRGATLIEQAIFHEEAARVGLPGPFNVVGLELVGPVLIRHGSDSQKDRFLEPLLRADEFWCQGFSEPNAGSDLAALTTRAIREPGGWRIYGQKIWTSLAHLADWCSH
jgi:alkylation response protein AidB-like acyl-CoA dehydrogenase